MVDPIHTIINSLHNGPNMMFKSMLKTFMQFGAYIIGISLLFGLIFLMLKYPPVIRVPVDGVPYPEYQPYPGAEHEYRIYMEERYLEYRRTT